MKKTALCFCLLSISPLVFAKRIYDPSNLSKCQDANNYPLTIQLGSFKTEAGAYHLIRTIQAHHFQNVVIKPEQGTYKVIAGPFHQPSEGLAFCQSMRLEPVRKPEPVASAPMPITTASISPSSIPPNLWYVNGQVGGQYPHVSGSTTVQNGSGFPSPYNQDIYQYDPSGGSVLLGLGLGKRFAVEQNFIKTVGVGVEYQYFFSTTLNGQITQFSLPEFTNYNYTYPLATHLVLANLQVNFDSFYQVSPFFKLGLGGSIMAPDGYHETALPNVTPRISPNYGSARATNFAYTLGVGLEYPLSQQFLVNAGYQFSDLGPNESGAGEGTWSAEHLNFGRFQSSAFVLGGSYLFDFNPN